MQSVSQIIKLIKEAHNAHDTSKLGELLVSLIEKEPDKWMALLYMENIIPRPLSKRFRMGLGVLLEAVQTSFQFEEFKVEHFKNLFLPLLSIHIGLEAIVKRLDQLNVWEQIGSKVVYRVSAFLEDQFRISEHEMAKETKLKGYYDSEILLRDNIHTVMDDGSSSRLAGYETNCESLQLILSYAIHKYQDDFSGDVESCRTVYEDEDFSKLMALSVLWQKYEILWQRVIFQNWQPVMVDKANNINIYMPRDENEFLRSEIAEIRKQEMLYEIAGGSYLPIYSDTLENEKKLAHSIKLPLENRVWDCDIDISVLRQSITMPFDAVYAEYEIYRYHYDEIANDIRLGDSLHSISWNNYQKALRVLRMLAKAYSLAVDETLNDRKMGDEFSRVAIIEKNRLIEIFCDSLDFDIAQSESVLSATVFSPALKNVEIWDRPLVEIDNEKILFVPALVEMGSPARAMENFIAQWNPNLFAKRGRILENKLKEFLQEHHINAQGRVIFSSIDNQRIECDLVAFWQGYLMLIEAKCTKDIFNAADAFRAKQHIEDAIDQLIYRKKEILSNWESFRSAADDLILPEQVISSERIKLIAVTNVLHFTSWVTNEVHVTDEFCFKRFFGDADVKAITISNDEHQVAGVIGRIRKHVTPTVEEFFSYLENPPQVQAIKKCLTLETIPFPIINDGDPKLGIVYSTYHPERHPARIAARKLLGRRSKKRKRYHKKKK